MNCLLCSGVCDMNEYICMCCMETMDKIASSDIEEDNDKSEKYYTRTTTIFFTIRRSMSQEQDHLQFNQLSNKKIS